MQGTHKPITLLTLCHCYTHPHPPTIIEHELNEVAFFEYRLLLEMLHGAVGIPGNVLLRHTTFWQTVVLDIGVLK